MYNPFNMLYDTVNGVEVFPYSEGYYIHNEGFYRIAYWMDLDETHDIVVLFEVTTA
jgi:hypothetical protein